MRKLNRRAYAVGVAIVALAFVALPVLASPLADTATITPSADAIILKGFQTHNYGASAYADIGAYSGTSDVRRELVSFDLSSIPAGSTVSSATLSLWLNTNYASNSTTMYVYRYLTGWLEGTGDDVATGDGATWLTYDGVHGWITPGGTGSGTLETSAIGSLAMASGASVGQYYDWTLDAASVQAMLPGGGFTNSGFQIRSGNESSDMHRFASREDGNSAHWPKLVIVYTAPTPTPTSTNTPVSTNTPTVTLTPTNTPTPTTTPSPTPSNTPIPGSGPSAGTAGTGSGAHNFWYWLLTAAQDFLFTYFLPFLPRHVDWGIAQTIEHYAGPVLLVFYLGVGSFIHLATLFRIIQLMIMMEGVQAIFAGRKIVAKIIKYATIIGLLG